MGREWPNLGGLARLSYAKTADLLGSIFFVARARTSLKNRHSIHYSSSCRGKHFILGDIAMVIVLVGRPRDGTPSTPCCTSLTMTSGRLGRMYCGSRRRTRSGEVRGGSLNKFRLILWGLKTDCCILNVKNAQMIIQAH